MLGRQGINVYSKLLKCHAAHDQMFRLCLAEIEMLNLGSTTLPLASKYLFVLSLLLQVKLAISHYILSNDRSQVSSEKPLVFALDNVKQDDGGDEETKKRKEKKRKPSKSKTTTTVNSFGSGLKISQFKGNPKFVIGFRARLGMQKPNCFNESIIANISLDLVYVCSNQAFLT